MNFTEIKDISGWAAFLGTIWYGGKLFMSLAREFKDDVVKELKELNTSVRSQEKHISDMIEKINDIDSKVSR